MPAVNIMLEEEILQDNDEWMMTDGFYELFNKIIRSGTSESMHFEDRRF